MSDIDMDRGPGPRAGHERLAPQLLAPAVFPHFAADCEALIASEIKKKGVALRTVFNLVQKAKPDIVERAVRELMPEFVRAIEPCYADYRAGDAGDLRGYLMAHDQEVADAMLTVADRRAEKIQNRTVRSAYNRVRGRAQKEIITAMPGIAATIAKHAN